MSNKQQSIYAIIIMVSALNLSLGKVFLFPAEGTEFYDYYIPQLNEEAPLRNSSVLASLAVLGPEEDFDSIIHRQSSFLASSLPGALADRAIIKHEVQLGDTVSSIALRYGVSVNSILWSNGLEGKDPIFPGQVVSVPPTNGIIHSVKPGETVSSLALKYGAKSSEIIGFNNLPRAGDLRIAQVLVIPNGKIKKSGKTIRKFFPKQLRNLGGYFSRPTTGRISQGLHPYNAVDVANSCGTPIYAAASGQVVISYNDGGWHGAAGNYIKIKHSNGTATLYAHLKATEVVKGQSVSKGQVIGYMGHTGRTRPTGPAGCHLHFGVYGAKNPLAR